MKKKIENEINLYEIFYILFSNKFKILIITIASILITILFEQTIKIDKSQNQNYLLTFSIDPIDKFDELKYSTYNNLFRDGLKRKLTEIDIKLLEGAPEIKSLMNTSLNLNDFSFFKIETSSLYNLALDKINNKKSFIKLLNKTDLFKKKKYLDGQEYKNSRNLEIQTMKMFPNKSKINHRNIASYNFSLASEKFDTLEKSNQFVEELEKIINLEIKDEITEQFNKLYTEQKNNTLASQKYLNGLIATTTDEQLIKILNIKSIEKDFELENINRMNKVFNNTPLNSENFSAVELNLDNSSYLNLNKNKTTNWMNLFIKSTIFGILSAMIFTLIYHYYFNRKKLRLKHSKNY